MANVLQLSMTTITIDGADRALDAGTWLLINDIDYEIALDSGLGPNPRYCFRFHNTKDATHFALRWQ
jgi:hypothetical protein